MTTTPPRRPIDELARLGDEMVDRLRPGLRPEDQGKFVAIDVRTGEYEIDPDDHAAVSRIWARLPAPEVWLARIGYPAACRIGVAR